MMKKLPIYPSELQDKVARYYQKKDAKAKVPDLDGIKPVDGKKQFVFLGKYFVESHNTAGSDDYHPFVIVCRHNMKQVFDVEFRRMIARTFIFEKMDPNAPAFVVMEDVQQHTILPVIVW